MWEVELPTDQEYELDHDDEELDEDDQSFQPVLDAAQDVVDEGLAELDWP